MISPTFDPPKMKVLLFGLTGFGNDALRAVRRAGADVVGLVTRRESGPFPYYPERGLEAEAAELGIPVFTDENINTLDFAKHVTPLEPDLIVVATFHQRIPHRILKLPKVGAVAVHPSLLPTFRGPTPTTWALIEGETETGVSLHELELRPYEGTIYARETVPIGPDDTDGTLRRRLSAAAAGLIERHIRLRMEGAALTPVEQNGAKLTLYPARSRRDALITFDEPTKNVYNRIRATSPYPGPYSYFDGREYSILSAEPLAGESYEVQPGLVTDRNDGRLTVKTKDGRIRITVAPDLPPEDAGVAVAFSDVKALAARKISHSDIVHTREAYGIEEGAEEFPLMVVLAVAYPCNAKCPHCPYTEENSDIRLKYADQPYVDPELFKKIARECGRYNAFLRITGGGEPMMHPAGMVDLIEYAKSVGSRVWMNTNGSKINEDKIDRLLACGTDMIEFSVDAGAPEHYAIVRKGLDWDNLVWTVRTMVGRRNATRSSTRISASIVMQDIIKDRAQEYIDFWKHDVKVDEVITRKFLTWGSNTTIDAAKAIDETPYLDKTRGEPCPYPFQRLNVDSRGKIEVCGFDIVGRTNLGNCAEKSIKEIWLGPEFTWWRQLHAERRGGEIPLCRECPDWQYRSWTHNYKKVYRKAGERRQIEIDLIARDDTSDLAQGRTES